jgi:hypothetical protein
MLGHSLYARPPKFLPIGCVHSACSNSMVQHITSKATVESSDENEGTGPVDDEDSNSSPMSISSDSENNDSALVQAFDKILTGQTKSKGKGKGKKTQGTEQDASEFISRIYVPLSPIARE